MRESGQRLAVIDVPLIDGRSADTGGAGMINDVDLGRACINGLAGATDIFLKKEVECRT